jgi:hypothetical protein
MADNPAFQGSPKAVQVNAFQSGVMLVAAGYSLGSPAFATPTPGANYVFPAPVYSIGSLEFTSPGFASGSNFIGLAANAYSLGSPSFGAPSINAIRILSVASFSLGSPAFAVPIFKEKHLFFTNAYILEPLEWGDARLARLFQLSAPSYSLGPLDFSPPNPPFHVNHVMAINDYSLQSPKFGYPRFQWEIVDIGLPPTYLTQITEAGDMLETLLNLLMRSLPSNVNTHTNTARRLIDVLRSNAEAAIRGDTLGTQLADIYAALDRAEAAYPDIETARRFLVSQTFSPSIFTQIVFRSALLMNLALQCSIITRMEFKTREEAHNMVVHVRDMFDLAKIIGIDEVDVLVYQSVTTLGGAVMNYLSNEALELPRFVEFETQISMPSLYLAQRIYQDASRSDEIERENGIIHPAFCQRRLRVLSNRRTGARTTDG